MANVRLRINMYLAKCMFKPMIMNMHLVAKASGFSENRYLGVQNTIRFTLICSKIFVYLSKAIFVFL